MAIVLWCACKHVCIKMFVCVCMGEREIRREESERLGLGGLLLPLSEHFLMVGANRTKEIIT